MTLYKWSQTAAADATADSSINWQEGQAPSSINDSARAMMAAIAKYRDDMTGAIVTGGTSTAYSVSSYQAFDTLAHMASQAIAFTPHTTNGATVTLNVDSLGAKPLRSAPSVELPAGVLVQGTPYVALYSNADQAFYLHGFYASPYLIPIGGGLDYWGATAPNSSFAFPSGQAISRTTYSTLFSIIGTTYGVGDGSTTFNLPDKTGRVSAMKEAVVSRLTVAHFGGNSVNLGAVGGVESSTLTLAQLPTGITSSNSSQNISVSSTNSILSSTGGVIDFNPPSASGFRAYTSPTTYGSQPSTGVNSIAVTSNNTSGNAHNNVQPTIICNYIIRII